MTSRSPGVMTRAERRKVEIQLQVVLVLADLGAVLVAMMLAYGIRFHSLFTLIVPVTKGVPSWSLYFTSGLAMAVSWVPLFAALGLYRPRNRLDFPTQLDLALRGVAVGMLLALALTFFYRGASYSRIVVPMTSVLALLLVPAFRIWAGRALLAWRPVATGVAVAGSGKAAAALAGALARHPAPGTKLVGLFADRHPAMAAAPAAATSAAGAAPAPAIGDTAALRTGGLADVAAAAGAGHVQRVLLAPTLAEAARIPELVERLLAAGVDVEWVPEIPGLAAGRARVDLVEGVPVIPLGEFPLLGWNGVVKRAMDLGLATLGLVGLAPLFAVITLAVRTTSRGPAIYRQERVGRDGRRFQMLKFRSMVAGAEDDCGPVRTRRDDPRRTRLGRFLRRTSLDELPQLWNVLKGEMSLVGPRPERPALIDDLVREIPGYPRRHRVKSGMTGWAQVHGLRGADSSMKERVIYDLYYIENWSVGLDVSILARTLVGLLRQPNAY